MAEILECSMGFKFLVTVPVRAPAFLQVSGSGGGGGGDNSVRPSVTLPVSSS